MKNRVYFALLVLTLFGLDCRTNTEDLKKRSDKILDDIAAGIAAADFPEKYFPKAQTAQLMGQLQNFCDFKNRRGNFENDFHQVGIGTPDKMSYIYEFFLKSDTIRVILTYVTGSTNELFGFNMEKATRYNPMILHRPLNPAANLPISFRRTA